MRTKNRNEESRPKGAKNNAGFYIALAICIMTVAAAAWTTYGSITTDIENNNESSVGDMQTANDVSGESYDKAESSDLQESSAADESSEQKESKKSSESPASSSAPEVSTKAAEAKKESAVQEPKVFFPVENGDVVKPFSVTAPVYSKTMADWRAHKGIDIKAKEGAAVRSVTEGIVMDVVADPLYGNTIIIAQSGCTVRYSGLSEKSVVKKGDHIDAGTVIGYVGTVPCEQLDASHIHMEAISGERYIDPMTLFDKKLSK